jgi:hypothetical protein
MRIVHQDFTARAVHRSHSRVILPGSDYGNCTGWLRHTRGDEYLARLPPARPRGDRTYSVIRLQKNRGGPALPSLHVSSSQSSSWRRRTLARCGASRSSLLTHRSVLSVRASRIPHSHLSPQTSCSRSPVFNLNNAMRARWSGSCRNKGLAPPVSVGTVIVHRRPKTILFSALFPANLRKLCCARRGATAIVGPIVGATAGRCRARERDVDHTIFVLGATVASEQAFWAILMRSMPQFL